MTLAPILCSRFNFSILIASVLVIVFLNYSAQFFDFFDLNQTERVLALLFKVTISIFIYFIISRIIRGHSFKEFLNYLDISQEHFWDVGDSWRAEHLWEKKNNEWLFKNPIK